MLCLRSLQGNRLTGVIPEVIGLMQALAVLYVSQNLLIYLFLSEVTMFLQTSFFLLIVKKRRFC